MLDNIASRVIISNMILEKIAEAIKKSGKSRYRISKETGIDQAVLCRIVSGNGKGQCSLDTADKLCKYLGLKLVLEKRHKTQNQKPKEG
ncbi:MAG: helix-turn-helix domain-containing protein [Sedimentisphaerales bacterium]|nr:helix-turn-helix domain-containing protein [Sedimentisphaerales bacterium]